MRNRMNLKRFNNPNNEMPMPQLKFSDIPGFKFFVAWGIFVLCGMIAVIGVAIHFLSKVW